MDVSELKTSAVPVFGRIRSLGDRRRWLTARKAGIGSSDIAAVLGESTYGSAFSVYFTKLPEWEDEWRTAEQMEHGVLSEPQLAKKIAAELRDEWKIITPPASMWRHPEHEFALCSPDRLAVHKVTGEVRPVELKTDQNPGRWADLPPEPYRIQLGWQCLVFGAARGFMCAEISHRYRIYDVAYDPLEFGGWVHAASEFWQQVTDGIPPDIDGHDATTKALKELYPDFDPDADPVVVADALAAEYDDADAAEKAAKKRLTEARNRLLAQMGNGTKAVDSEGRTVAYRIRFDKKEHVVAASTQDQLRAGTARRNALKKQRESNG